MTMYLDAFVLTFFFSFQLCTDVKVFQGLSNKPLSNELLVPMLCAGQSPPHTSSSW